MKTPHKHAELIKAWADGAEIEYFSEAADGWYICNSPQWARDARYRIKPEKKWYRVAEFFSINPLGRQIAVADCLAKENSWPETGDFCRWITDRIYYE